MTQMLYVGLKLPKNKILTRLNTQKHCFRVFWKNRNFDRKMTFLNIGRVNHFGPTDQQSQLFFKFRQNIKMRAKSTTVQFF